MNVCCILGGRECRMMMTQAGVAALRPRLPTRPTNVSWRGNSGFDLFSKARLRAFVYPEYS